MSPKFKYRITTVEYEDGTVRYYPECKEIFLGILNFGWEQFDTEYVHYPYSTKDIYGENMRNYIENFDNINACEMFIDVFNKAKMAEINGNRKKKVGYKVKHKRYTPNNEGCSNRF